MKKRTENTLRWIAGVLLCIAGYTIMNMETVIFPDLHIHRYCGMQ